MNRSYTFFRYLAYSLEILLAYILIGIPGLVPELFGSKPCVLLCIGVTIAFFEREITAMVFGLICGLLTDTGYGNNFCFFAAAMMVFCFFIAYFAENIMVTNLPVIWTTTFIIVLVTVSTQFLFSYLLKGYGEPGTYFLNHYVSRIVYTTLLTPIFYGLNRLFTNLLYD